MYILHGHYGMLKNSVLLHVFSILLYCDVVSLFRQGNSQRFNHLVKVIIKALAIDEGC